MPARNKADPDWDRHKAIIESSYVEKNLKLEGTGGLMDTMARSHGFAKSKSQYESQFKVWGMRKYRKKDDWKSIGRNVAERKRAGKVSDVYINGELIPNSRVQKQIRRHAFTTAFERNLPAPSPRTPDDFDIRTPVAEEIVPFTRLPGATPSLTETRGCVSSQLQSVSSAMPSQTVTSDASLPVHRNAMSSSPPMAPTDLLPIQSQDAIPSTPYVPGMYGSPVFLFEDLDEYFRSLNYASDLPFCQFEDGLHAQFKPSLISTNAQIFGSELTLETILFPEHYHNVFNKDVDVLHEVPKVSETFTAVLKALLPSAARVSQAENQVILSPNHHRSDSAFSKLFTLLIFAMANNFAGLNSVPINEIMDYLKGQTSNRLLQHVLSSPGPESEAFAENLFQAAILMEDARIVEVLLQKGLDPHDLVCVDHGSKYTPLEYSSMTGNVAITRLLLDAKLDVNKSVTGENGSGRAMNYAITRPWRRNEHPRELVHMLLEAGGKFSWSQLEPWTLQGDQEVLDLLLDNYFKTKTYKQAWNQFVHVLMEKCDNATATRTITKFLKAGDTMNHRVSSTVHRKLGIALGIAAERGNLELVQLLLCSRVSFTRGTLVCAIKSKNKELIRFLLDNGADVVAFDESAHKLWYEDFLYHSPAPSPLSEAIRWGDAEILDLLEEMGAWSRIINKVTAQGEFEDVLIAASVRGQLTTVQKLLNYRPPNTDGNDLGDALVAAICVKEEAIVLTLLDAGANVNVGSRKASDIDAAVKEGFDSASNIDEGTNEPFREDRSAKGPALLEALRQKNEQLVRLLLDADVNLQSLQGQDALVAAVEWGNLSIIKELISMGAWIGWVPLKVSVKKKNMECTQLLVNAGADLGSRDAVTSALPAAVINRDFKMVEYLLSMGADPANSDALFQALPQGLPMIERLLTAFVRRYPHGVPGYGHNTFQRAIEEGNPALIEILLDAKIDVRTGFHARSSLLLEAITQQHATSLAILQRLLDEIGNPNIVVQASRGQPCHRETALLVAIDTEDIQKVKMLIDAGANVDWPATKGVKRTPLQKAAEIGSYAITQLLINKGGLVNNEPAVRGGATALQLAAIGGYVGIAELLLENEADVNAAPARVNGRTALEGAAEHGRIDMLKLLWNAGAKIQGAEYETALQLAKENGHMATRRYLEFLYGPPEGISIDT